MKLAITDANIFIDLIKINSLPLLFRLEIELYTTIEVLNELLDHQKPEVLSYQTQGMLTIDSGISFQSLYKKEINKRLSYADSSVIYYAHYLKAGILTGDYSLRKFVEENTEVHGILWLLCRFVEQKLMTETMAHQSLTLLISGNHRLPMEECEKLLKKWEN
ncbi:MAG: hypothetical protein ACK4ND_08975 [Cytophagaceae bacterium]